MNYICGETKQILYDKNIKEIEFELFTDDNDIPLIAVNNNVGTFFTLHIKEAIELKSIIDNLIIDYNQKLIDDLKTELNERGLHNEKVR